MKRQIVAVLTLCLVGNSLLFAQTVQTVSSSEPTIELGAPQACAEAACQPACCDAFVSPCAEADWLWARADYLLWWVKGSPLPVPIVTTGNPSVGFPGTNSAGAIGQPGTQVLLGNSPVDFGATSGVRVTLGGWLDQGQSVGAEASGFLLGQRSSRFATGSDAAGNPPLYFPIFNVGAGAERGVPISDPLRQFSGNVDVTSSVRLWGSEINGAFRVGERGNVTLLAGFRYADLSERLRISNTTTDLQLVETDVLQDNFSTRNQFYGGQLGARASWQWQRLGLDLTGKIALGSSHQVVDIQGNITQFGPGAFAPGTHTGGLYTQPTNIGRRTSDQFAVLPSVEAKGSYQITDWLRITLGYDFLYWSRVVRPGDQIDRNVNVSQSPVFGNGVLAGGASPSSRFEHSDFWAQGMSFGLELRY